MIALDQLLLNSFNLGSDCCFKDCTCFLFKLFRKFFTFKQCLNICFDVDTFFFDEFFFSLFRLGNNFLGIFLRYCVFCFGNYFLVFGRLNFCFFSRSSLSVDDILNLLEGSTWLLQLVRIVIGF